MIKDKAINNSIEYLPTKLVNEIMIKIFDNSKYQYPSKNNFLKCISLIYTKQLNEYFNLEYYVPLGSAYWKKVFKSHNYSNSIIQPLIDMGIIESKRFGFATYRNEIDTKSDTDMISKSKGIVEIRYRINPRLTDCEEFATINYLNRNKNKISTYEIQKYEDELKLESLTIDGNPIHLTIDRDKAIQWITDSAWNVCNNYLKIDHFDTLPKDMSINYYQQLSGGSFENKYGTVKTAMLIAELKGMKLFLFNDSYYIADLDEFLDHRKKAITHHYIREINKITMLPIVDKRNTRNLRLYNHLVNFPSRLLPFIRFNNRTIVQLDLRTSQFLLFANLLNTYIIHGVDGLNKLFIKPKTRKYIKHLVVILEGHRHLMPRVPIDINNPKSCSKSDNDVHQFIRDVFFSDFYSVVKKELQLPDRITSKQILFKLMFTPKVKGNVVFVQLVKKYPTVMSIISGFKSYHQKSAKTKTKDLLSGANEINDIYNFPIFLQCVEAEIFIDNILFDLRKKNIPCSSRHDSILVADGFQDDVEYFIREVFEKFGFMYNQKVDDYFWDAYSYDELEEMDYHQWIMDENVLNDDFQIEIFS